jgi:hypothetical protein
MNTPAPARTRMHPASEEDQQLVRHELKELLKSPHFSNSKRYPALLSYVVEKSITGRAEELKERILGIEVFHRPSDYDTNNDTIVRVAAGEVRKRLALVYHESEVEHLVQITLPAGSYIPEFFRLVEKEPSAEGLADPVFEQPSAVEIAPAFTPPPSRTWWWKAVFAFVFVVLGIGSALFIHRRALAQQSSVDLFWQPVRASSTPVIVCPGAMVRSYNSPSGMAMAEKEDDYPYTSMATTLALADLVGLLVQDQIVYDVQPTSTTSVTDMREHPIILIGAYNNEWSLRLQDELRYRFAADPARQIYDTVHPETVWMRPANLPLNEEDDFAIVARFHSKLTDNLVLLVAGIGKNGTEAAAQFATNARTMDLLNQHAKEWASKNVEVVLKVQVIDGKSGEPSIEAAYTW